MARYDNYGPLDGRYVEAGDTFFRDFNSRLRPDQLSPGTLAYSSNGRMAQDGAWQTRKGVNYFGGPLFAASEALILPFYLYASVNISSATRSLLQVTVTTSSAHGFVSGSQVGIAGLTGTADPNGNRTVTVTGASTFTFNLSAGTGSETYGGSGTAGAPYLADENAAYGSCLYSDPSDENSLYIIQAQYDRATATSLTDGTSTDIDYPVGITLTADVTVLQAFSKVYIFRDGATALEWNGSFSGSPAFTKVANGNYTQPTVFTASNNTAATAGVVTVTEAAHGLSVGDKVTIFDNGSTSLTENSPYTVATVPGSGSFTFYADTDDFAATSVVMGVRQSNGRGYTHMPAPPWAVYHQRRLIVPFNYTTTGSSGSETITDRNVRDEILFSDVFDSDTYDQLQNQFKVTAGIADYLQTIHPFTDDNAVAFNRNSIHLISGLSGALTDVTIKEITREAGLVARNSVVAIGNKIFFLSDNGVYATEFGDLYNLRGAGLPLSDPIDSVIKRINSSYAYKAVGCFHDNRYWLAVPLDDSTVNNFLLVYNVLNQGWESVDSIDSSSWDVSNLLSAGPGVKRLYAVNRYGGIHILDDRDDDSDVVALVTGISSQAVAIESHAISRLYTMGTLERKRYKNFSMDIESGDTNATDGTIAVETENMDATATLGTISGYLGGTLDVDEDATIRGRIGGYRGYGIQMTVTPTQGRPKLRSLKVDGVLSFNSLTQIT